MVKFIGALMFVVCLVPANAVHAQELAKPVGKWERKVGKNHVVLIVEDHRLHVVCTGEKTVTLHADYAMTRDGLVYGVVTSIECDEDEEVGLVRTLFDAPFCFRFRIDEEALIIHDMKAHGADSRDDMWNGRYKAVRPAATRAETIPASYPTYLEATSSWPPSYLETVPAWAVPHVRQLSALPPPSPIAPSFSSPVEKHPNMEEK